MNNENLKLSHISIFCLVRNLVRHAWMIVAAFMILSMGASIVLNWFHVPKYQASMTYAVTSRRTSYNNSSNVGSTKEFTSVLTEMMGTPLIVHNIRGYAPELENFDGTITATQLGETNLIQVSSVSYSPETAYLAIEALEAQLPTIVDYISGSCIVQVIRNPATSSSPINPVNPREVSKLSGIVGSGLMILYLCWYSISRETIQTRTGARHMLDAPIIASVNRVWKKRTLKSLLKPIHAPVQVFDPTTQFSYTEQINTICAQLEHDQAEGCRLFMVTGVGENEGKSTIAGNVASALAMMGKKVALVDCDLRNPSLVRFFNKKYTTPMPLNKMLGMPFSRENLLECMVPHETLGLYMLLAMAPDKRCTELLTGPTMQKLLLQLRVFDYVILDTPPMGYFADTESLADMVDCTMLVVRQDKTPAADINDAADLLRGCKSRFLGCILNDMTSSITEGSGYGYGYGYGYGQNYHYGKPSSRKES